MASVGTQNLGCQTSGVAPPLRFTGWQIERREGRERPRLLGKARMRIQPADLLSLPPWGTQRRLRIQQPLQSVRDGARIQPELFAANQLMTCPSLQPLHLKTLFEEVELN